MCTRGCVRRLSWNHEEWFESDIQYLFKSWHRRLRCILQNSKFAKSKYYMYYMQTRNRRTIWQNNISPFRLLGQSKPNQLGKRTLDWNTSLIHRRLWLPEHQTPCWTIYQLFQWSIKRHTWWINKMPPVALGRRVVRQVREGSRTILRSINGDHQCMYFQQWIVNRTP